jgi:energy-coupling factor transporter ATP-binding protein EcfA2
MATNPDNQALIIEDLKKQSYFSIKDNGAKTRIRAELAEKYNVEAVWIKDVVINGYGKEGRRIDDNKIIEILGSSVANVGIMKTSEDPAEGTATFKEPAASVYFVSSAPGQVGIGLMKIMSATNGGGSSGLIIVNNGNDGPLADNEFNEIKIPFDKLGINTAAVYSGGISHKPKAFKLVQKINDGELASLRLLEPFTKAIKDIDLHFHKSISQRSVAALLSKRFLIFTGLSGSGKTKLAQAFAHWLTPDPGWVDDLAHEKGKKPNPCVALIAVGADWTSNENLLGYPDALKTGIYRKPDNGVLDLLLAAKGDSENPYFLILDEMNLSHVERYFADFLSAMESGEDIALHDGVEDDKWPVVDGGAAVVPRKLKIPKNVFVIGTVNVDETTYMFSPKVLDRANVIEFRVTKDEMDGFLKDPKKPNLDSLAGGGKELARAFVTAAGSDNFELDADVKSMVNEVLLPLFAELEKVGAEFGYRSAYDICRFIHFHKQLAGEGWTFDKAMDAAIAQKLLPKLHGSKKKLEGCLRTLQHFCLKSELQPKDVAAPIGDALVKEDCARYWVSLEKLSRMQKRLRDHGFTSFAES